MKVAWIHFVYWNASASSSSTSVSSIKLYVVYSDNDICGILRNTNIVLETRFIVSSVLWNVATSLDIIDYWKVNIIQKSNACRVLHVVTSQEIVAGLVKKHKSSINIESCCRRAAKEGSGHTHSVCRGQSCDTWHVTRDGWLHFCNAVMQECNRLIFYI